MGSGFRTSGNREREREVGNPLQSFTYISIFFHITIFFPNKG
jgi:hypothetical protein